MNRQHTRLWITLWALSSASALSAPIRNLVFTEVIKDVSILNVATKKATPAKIGDVLVPPNILKTGGDSRAELIAEDKTVTRVGSNTVFSVDANTRDINLGQGSVLFHSPTGKGGGTIKSAGATASVLGTTLIVGANPSGGFKTMLLEGKGQVTAPGSRPVRVTAGQLSFAMPGQKPSAPLNFSLKGQVGSSKLVNGFSKPVASIAKIDAAITQQQEKIAKGGLSTTDLVIGDRPDTAFKLDTVIVNVVINEQEKQEAQKIASRNELDPRYVQYVVQNLSLTSEFAPGDNIFAIDGSGVNPGTSFGLPTYLPGNREEFGTPRLEGTYSALVANNITFEATGLPPTKEFPIFLPTPVDVPSDLNHAAIVALNNLNFNRNLLFLNLSAPYTDYEVVDTNGVPLTSAQSSQAWRPLTQLLLSAGNSLGIAPGVSLQADIPLFEIYAAGASYSSDINLAVNAAAETQLPVINWTGVGLINRYGVESDSPASGIIRIKAPSIALTDSGIQAGGALEILSTNDLSITHTGNTPTLMPLGFDTAADLTLNAYSVKLSSARKAITLSGVDIKSNTVFLTAGTDITLSGVTIIRTDATTPGDRSISITANRNLTLIDTELKANTVSTDTPNLQILTVDLSAGGNVTIDAADVLTDTQALQTPTVVEYKKVILAKKVNITGGANVVIRGLQVQDETGAGTSTSSEFNATAANILNLNKVDLNQSQKVALAGSTVVLADVQYKAGSYVNIRSASGLVAADPGWDRPVRNGMVNFIRNVKYGSTEIKSTVNTNAPITAAGLTADGLRSALGANGSAVATGNLATNPGISIGVK